MTESEWLACTDPGPMLEFLRGKASDRKLRLFACACCRHVWDLLLDERSRKAIDAAEQYADGQISVENLAIIRNAARSARKTVKRTIPLAGFSPAFNAARAADTVVEDSVESAVAAVGWVASAIGNQAMPDPAGSDFDDTYEAIQHYKMFCASPLLRELFGNPFQTVTLNQSWLAPNVVSFAQAIYEDRAFGRMPELADALEEAGCDNPEILAHCRQPGPHVRGCWVVDAVLGKE
jgi:hypothetical protein